MSSATKTNKSKKRLSVQQTLTRANTKENEIDNNQNGTYAGNSNTVSFVYRKNLF